MIERRPLSEQLTKDVDPRAVDEVWHRIEAKRQRGRRPLAAVAAVAVAMLALVIGLGRGALFEHAGGEAAPTSLRLVGGAPLPAAVEAHAEELLVLDDGSRVTVERGARLATEQSTATAVGFRLLAGAATFDVKPHGPRAWSVDAGLAVVSVRGTKFRVARAADVVTVDVTRGHVVVKRSSDGTETALHDGERVEVRREAATDERRESVSAEESAVAAVADDARAPVVPTPAQAAAPAPRTAPSAVADGATARADEAWKPLVREGDYKGAYGELGHEGVVRETATATTPAALLELADVARLSGHPADAVAPLERLLAEHASAPNAAAAAFTLGKIQLEELASPAAAARAFERSLALGPPRALREDVLARRVEAYAKAGDAARARAARAAYDEAHPGGRHARAVETWAP